MSFATGSADSPQQQQQAAALVLALLGQLLSTINFEQSTQMDRSNNEHDADAVEELTEFWLRTVGIVAGARAKGHEALSTAVARSKWLERLRPTLSQLRSGVDLDERLTEALQSLIT